MTVPATMTPDEAATALQIPKTTVLALCRRGVLPACKLGRSWRIYRAAIPNLFGASTVRDAPR
jgi:excisionase family DNA binding protein